MVRKLKVLGTTLVAALAMCAVIASAAQATTLTASNATGAHEHATLAATQIGNDTYKFGTRELICSNVDSRAHLLEQMKQLPSHQYLKDVAPNQFLESPFA